MKRSPTVPARLLLLSLALALAPALTGDASAAGIPPSFSAIYEVQRALFTVGRTRVVFSRPSAERYVYSSRSVTTGLAALFRDTRVNERSEGRITDTGLRPERYRYERTGSEARSGELRFYWDDGQVVNDVGGRPWRLDIPPDTKDRVVGSVQLMHDLAAGERELRYPVADGGRLRTYRFNVTGRERVDSALGELEALRVVRTDDDGPGTTVLWCAPSLSFLPIRIEHSDPEEGDYTMTLERVDFRRPGSANQR